MTPAACPYCRGAIDASAGEQLECPGCGTPHHSDCYAENGGCTVFGCTAAPAEEPKLRLSGSELAGVGPAAGQPLVPSPNRAVGQPGLPAAGERVKAPPPPPPPGSAAVQKEFIPRFGVGSVLFSAQPVPMPVVAATQAPLDFDLEPDPDAKNRMTFIVLGVLLGAFGAHNFYAGYRKKAASQLCLSVLTMGLGSPMSWVWAVIDVCTVERDGQGIKFKS